MKDALDTVEIDLDACAAGVLVITDSYFPGWEATLDGQPASIERVDLIVRGVRVGKGKHRVVMRYRPSSFRIGAALSLLSLLALLLVLVGRRRARAT